MSIRLPGARGRGVVTLLSILLLLGVAMIAPAQDQTNDEPAKSPNEALRPEAVGWARLKTPSQYWRRHATGDPSLMHFLRQYTTLNIDPVWYVADVENLKQMCAYPLLFSQGIHVLNTKTSKDNLAEYMRRGGFLLIDSCIYNVITPDPDEFYREQVAMLGEILPEATVTPLPPTHDVYSCFFNMSRDERPPHTYSNDNYDPDWAKFGLYGIMIGNRMAGMISLSGLQCGWDRMIAPPGHNIECMKMMVNIYIWSMMQPAGNGGGPTAAR